MDTQQTRATLTVALMAAFADGLKDERERASIKQLTDALGAESGIDLPVLYREVLLSKPDLASVVAPLTTNESRQFAYEMAVGVINATGHKARLRPNSWPVSLPRWDCQPRLPVP